MNLHKDILILAGSISVVTGVMGAAPVFVKKYISPIKKIIVTIEKCKNNEERK